MGRKTWLSAGCAIALLFAALTLAGCSGSSQGETTESQAGTSASETSVVGTWGANGFSVTFDKDGSMSSTGKADPDWGDVGAALQDGEEYSATTVEGQPVLKVYSPNYDDVSLYYELKDDELRASTSPVLSDYPNVLLVRE